MSLSVKITPTAGAAVWLAGADDVVTGIGFGGDSGETDAFRGFRCDRGAMIPRGGQLDAFTFSVDRTHADHNAAIAHLVNRRRTVRALAMNGPLTAEFRTQSGAEFVFSFTDATIAMNGEPRLVGIRTVETFTVTGALSDA